jgi:hypothetical protein
MKVGNFIMIKETKKYGIIVRIDPPTVRFPAEFARIIFFDGTPPSDYLERSLKILS